MVQWSSVVFVGFVVHLFGVRPAAAQVGTISHVEVVYGGWYDMPNPGDDAVQHAADCPEGEVPLSSGHWVKGTTDLGHVVNGPGRSVMRP